MLNSTVKKRDLITGLVCLGWGIAIAISVINHLFSFWSFSLELKLLYLGIAIPLCGLIVYWMFMKNIYPALGQDIYRLGSISLILGIVIIFFADYWLYVVPMPPQQMLVIEVSGEKDANSTGSEVWLHEVRDPSGKKVPFSKLEKDGEWKLIDGFLFASGNQPSKLSFMFTLNQRGTLELLFLSHPNGGIAEIKAGDRHEVVNLFQASNGDTLISIEANNSLVDWRMRLALYTADALVFVLGLLFLLMLISKSDILQLSISRLSSLVKTKQFGMIISIFVVAIFIFLSLAYTLGRIGNTFSRMSLLSSDAANIASFAAALDHPELFFHDPLLSNTDNFAFYFTIHVPLIRLLNHVFGNYGTAFVALLLPTLFVQLIGFYYLGVILYNSRFWATLLALVTAIPVVLPLGEFWGFYIDPLPRILFQALLPFLLGAAIKWGGQLKFWPWIMGCVGLLIYVHPVSAPAWGVAVLLGLWFSIPTIPIRHRLKAMAISGFVFLFVIAPFALNYLTTFSHSQAKNYDQVMEILSYRFAPGFLDLSIALQTFYQQMIVSSWIHKGLWIWTLIGFVVVVYLHRKIWDQNRQPYILASWWVGLLMISIVVPLIEHGILRALHRTPLEFDLIRGLRYTIPLLWIVSLWSLSKISSLRMEWASKSHQLGNGLWSLIIVLIGLGMMVAWGNQNRFMVRTNMASTYSCWKQEMLVCPKPEAIERADFLDAIRVLTPPGSSIFFQDLAIRYYSLRPITYTGKDGGALGYANHDSLLQWYNQTRELNAISTNIKNDPVAREAYVEFARKYGADYLVYEGTLDTKDENILGLRLVYRNMYGTLYEILR